MMRFMLLSSEQFCRLHISIFRCLFVLFFYFDKPNFLRFNSSVHFSSICIDFSRNQHKYCVHLTPSHPSTRFKQCIFASICFIHILSPNVIIISNYLRHTNCANSLMHSFVIFFAMNWWWCFFCYSFHFVAAVSLITGRLIRVHKSVTIRA